MKKAILILAIIVALLSGIGFWAYHAAHHTEMGLLLATMIAPDLISLTKCESNLDSEDPSLVGSTLYFFEMHKHMGATEKALTLLGSGVPNIWTSAATYLASIGRQESVPYLIKAFNTPFDANNAQFAEYLQELTGQDFGQSGDDWQAWWKASNPESAFSFVVTNEVFTVYGGRADRE